MKPAFITIGLLAASLTISSCASLTPPVRPDYTGADSVSSAQPSQLVGSWRVTELNPYPDAEPQDTVIEYRADGTVRGEVTPSGETAALMGDIRFEFLGQWSLDGDTVVHEDVTMNTIGGNGMAAMMAKMINSSENISGSANIYELSGSRIVMVGEDGNATQYVRQ